MRVTVVEDDSSNCEMMVLLLQYSGYETEGFLNGLFFMESNYKIPDIFVIDLQLPGKSGIEVCKDLKQRKETKDIPVILMSAGCSLEKLASLNCADDFLEKPFDIKDLLKKIDCLIKTVA